LRKAERGRKENNVHKILVGKPSEGDQLENLENNIKIDSGLNFLVLR